MGPPIRPCACPSCLSASVCVCVSGVWPKCVCVCVCFGRACVFRACGLSLSACRPACVFRACGLCVLRIFSWQMQHARWRLQRERHSGHSPGASGTQDILLARRAWPQPQHPLRTFSRNTPSVSVLRTSSWRVTAVASITGVPLDTSNKPEVVIPTHKQSEDDDSLPTKGTYDDYRDVNKIDEKPVHGSAITDHSTRMSVQLLIIARAITDHSTQFMHEDVSAITDHSTQFMHMYDRVPHELLEDVSAITDHSTRQACPSRTFDRHPTSSCRQSKTAHTVPVH